MLWIIAGAVVLALPFALLAWSAHLENEADEKRLARLPARLRRRIRRRLRPHHVLPPAAGERASDPDKEKLVICEKCGATSYRVEAKWMLGKRNGKIRKLPLCDPCFDDLRRKVLAIAPLVFVFLAVTFLIARQLEASPIWVILIAAKVFIGLATWIRRKARQPFYEGPMPSS